MGTLETVERFKVKSVHREGWGGKRTNKKTEDNVTTKDTKGTKVTNRKPLTKFHGDVRVVENEFVLVQVLSRSRSGVEEDFVYSCRDFFFRPVRMLVAQAGGLEPPCGIIEPKSESEFLLGCHGSKDPYLFRMHAAFSLKTVHSCDKRFASCHSSLTWYCRILSWRSSKSIWSAEITIIAAMSRKCFSDLPSR